MFSTQKAADAGVIRHFWHLSCIKLYEAVHRQFMSETDSARGGGQCDPSHGLLVLSAIGATSCVVVLIIVRVME